MRHMNFYRFHFEFTTNNETKFHRNFIEFDSNLIIINHICETLYNDGKLLL